MDNTSHDPRPYFNEGLATPMIKEKVTRSLDVCKKIKIKLWMLVDEWCHGRFVKHGLGGGN